MDSLTSMMTNVHQLKSLIGDDFDLSLAQQEAKKLYEEGSHWIVRLIHGEQLPNPLPIALGLVEVLSQPNIQLAYDLRYEVAKVSRLFIECVAWQACDDERRLSQETKGQFLACFRDAMKNLPREAVATQYELKSAEEAVKIINTEESALKKYAVGLGKALIGQSPSQVADLLWDAYCEKPRGWAYDGFMLTWVSHAALQQEDVLERFYEKIASYQRVPKVAFGALEAIKRLLEQAIKAGKSYEPFLRGNPPLKPGIFTFLDLEGSSFWEVRYRAIYHLHGVYPLLQDDRDKNTILEKTIRQIDQEKEKSFLLLLREIHKQRRQEPLWMPLAQRFSKQKQEAIHRIETDLKSLPPASDTQMHIPQANKPGKFRGDDDSFVSVQQTRENLLDKLEVEKDKLECFSL